MASQPIYHTAQSTPLPNLGDLYTELTPSGKKAQGD